MEIVRCSKGHFYDSEENATCPMCAAEAARNKNPLGNNILGDDILPTDYFGHTGDSYAVDNTPSPTMPVDPNGGKVQGYQPTVSADYQHVQSSSNGNMGAYPKTEPISPVAASSEESTTFDPVVGWLVCIEGAAKGTDYRIHSQNNYIGAAPRWTFPFPRIPTSARRIPPSSPTTTRIAPFTLAPVPAAISFG